MNVHRKRYETFHHRLAQKLLINYVRSSYPKRHHDLHFFFIVLLIQRYNLARIQQQEVAPLIVIVLVAIIGCVRAIIILLSELTNNVLM